MKHLVYHHRLYKFYHKSIEPDVCMSICLLVSFGFSYIAFRFTVLIQ